MSCSEEGEMAKYRLRFSFEINRERDDQRDAERRRFGVTVSPPQRDRRLDSWCPAFPAASMICSLRVLRKPVVTEGFFNRARGGCSVDRYRFHGGSFRAQGASNDRSPRRVSATTFFRPLERALSNLQQPRRELARQQNCPPTGPPKSGPAHPKPSDVALRSAARF